MGKILIVAILALFTVHYAAGAQDFLASADKPKYIPENKADEYLTVSMSARNNIIKITIESLEDCRNHSFYVLKGTKDSKGIVRWNIMKEYVNANKRTFRQSCEDEAPVDHQIHYRIMVKHEDERIEYTGLLSFPG
jgi:hypothetical protein